MSTPADCSPDGFASRLEARSKARTSDTARIPVERADYRKAAALLYSFDPRELSTPTRPEPGGAFINLVDDVTSVSTPDGPLWRLRASVRHEVLRTFRGPDEALSYLAANVAGTPEHSTPRVAQALLRGEHLDLDAMEAGELARVRNAVTWLSQIPGMPGLPDPHDVDHRLKMARLIEPIRTLLKQPFEGREDELAMLRTHLGVVAPTSLRKRAARAYSLARGRLHPDYPLVIYGPGGIGKSTLLARSLLDHIEDQDVSQFPFVYVDSERATVSLHEPMSLVAEIARQLAVQYPHAAADFTALAQRARVRGRKQRSRIDELTEFSGDGSTRGLGRSAQNQAYESSRDDEAGLSAELGSLLVAATGSQASAPPLVVALDSFEEAQYRASPILDRMWTMLASLRSTYPATRVVVAGRAPVGHPLIDVDLVPTIALGELDRGAAERFLLDRGVGAHLSLAIIARIGRNPLSLSLAARVARSAQGTDEDDTWIDEIPARRRKFFAAVDDMLIQGVLYERVLLHVTDPQVRALAHDGLILRRITPELVRDVLAPHAKIPLTSPGMHHELFEELARELDLVDRVGTDELWHRADVRRVMLRLLTAEKNRELRDLEQAAIEFYGKSDRPSDRAEEIYHRLRLGGSLTEVRERWLPEAGSYLEGAQAELPSRSARLLERLLRDASRPDPDDQFEWEQMTAAQVDNYLQQGLAEYAMQVLLERRPWTIASPLHALSVETQMRLGNQQRAREELTAALESPGIEEHVDAYLELLLLSARLFAGSGDLDSADADLEVAEMAASRRADAMDALAVLLVKAQLHEEAGRPHDQEVDRALLERVTSISDDQLTSRPALFRAVAAEVGEWAPTVLAQALRLVGLPSVSDEAIRELARTILRAIDQPEVLEVLAELAGEAPDQWASPRLEDIERLLDDVEGSGRLEDLVSHLLAVDGGSRVLAQGIADAMVEAVDPSGPTGTESRSHA